MAALPYLLGERAATRERGDEALQRGGRIDRRSSPDVREIAQTVNRQKPASASNRRSTSSSVV